MNWFKNQKTLTKLMLAFSLFAAVIGLVGYQGINGMGKSNTFLDQTYNKEMAGVSAIKDVNILLLELGRLVRQSILDSGDNEALRRDQAEYDRVSSDLEKSFISADPYFYTEQGKLLFGEVKKDAADYSAAAKEIVHHAMANEDKLAAAQLKNARSIADRTMDAALRTISFKQSRAAEFFHESQSAYSSTRNAVLVVVVVSVLFAIALGFGIARIIVHPLIEMVEAAKRLAAGNLDQRVEHVSADETGALAEAFRTMISEFSSTVSSIRQSSDQVAATAQQLSAASQQIASGAQEQASSLEETSSTLEELTSTVKQNAENARQANQLAAGAREAAEKGGGVMNSAVSAMNEINAASSRIAEIITTIDEIAFQTNLLALNAAVEAARAGEQGRGFAVVASEVRNLAQRSASAAREIKGLIQDSVRKVENGSELVNDSGRTLGEIVASVKRVTDIVGEIAAASQEQAAGVEQVAKATAQMDQVTQQNSAQTEEMSSTAEELSATAENLQQLVGRFVLDQRVTNTVSMTPRITTPKGKTQPAPHRPSRHQTKAGAPPSLVALAHQTGSSSDGFDEF